MNVQLKEHQEFLEELKHFLHVMIWSGFYNKDEIIEYATEAIEEGVFSESDIANVEDILSKVIDEIVAEKQKAEKSWPAKTECDKLSQAFEALTARGIVSLENAGYTMSDGWGDYQEAVHSQWGTAGKLKDVRGGCFYHAQALERAVNGEGLDLAFGAVSEHEAESIAVANEIIEVLKKHGFSPVWDGSIDQKIHFPIKWQRRYGPAASTAPPKK